MRKKALLFAALMALALPVAADSPAMPTPCVTANGDMYFTMLPSQSGTGSLYDGSWNGSGVAYHLRGDGTSVELWRTEGWYAFATHLSHDGHYLVREGDWAFGIEPDTSNLAVAFYRDGKLLKRYSTAELISDKNSVDRSFSHYIWRSYEGGYPYLDYDNRFYLRTIEDVFFVFDTTTGELIERTSEEPE